MRVYRKDLLFHQEHEALHTSGLWYAEPVTWGSAAPAQRGYPSLREAIVEAQMAEDCRRQARLLQSQASAGDRCCDGRQSRRSYVN
jgi:hypothetical protein